MKTDFLINFVDNCNFTAGKDGCLMRQHLPSFQEQEAKWNIGHSMNIMFALFAFSNVIHLFFVY